jgi:hypothetical protein
LKAAAVVTAGTVALGVGHEVAVRAPAKDAVASPPRTAIAPAVSSVVPAAPIAARRLAPAPAAHGRVTATTKPAGSTRGSARSAAVHAAKASRPERGNSAIAPGVTKAKVSRANGSARSAAAKSKAKVRPAAPPKAKHAVVKKPKAVHAKPTATPHGNGNGGGGGNAGGNGGGKDKGA